MKRLALIAILLVPTLAPASTVQDYECLGAVAAAAEALRDSTRYHVRRIVALPQLAEVGLHGNSLADLEPYVWRAGFGLDEVGILYVDDEGIFDFLSDLRKHIAINWAYTQFRQQAEAELRGRRHDIVQTFGVLPFKFFGSTALLGLVATQNLDPDSSAFATAVRLTGVSILGTAASVVTTLLSYIGSKFLGPNRCGPQFHPENIRRVADRFSLDTLVDEIEAYYAWDHPSEVWMNGTIDSPYETGFGFGRHLDGRRYFIFAYRVR